MPNVSPALLALFNIEGHMKLEKRICKLEEQLPDKRVSQETMLELKTWLKDNPNCSPFGRPDSIDEFSMPQHLKDAYFLKLENVCAENNEPYRLDVLVRLIRKGVLFSWLAD